MGQLRAPSQRIDEVTFGKVIHFLSIRNPTIIDINVSDTYAGASNVLVDSESEDILLALIQTIPVEYTSDKIFLRIVTGDNADTQDINQILEDIGSLAYIEAKLIYGLIGLVKCDQKFYITWEDTCLTDIGSSYSL